MRGWIACRIWKSRIGPDGKPKWRRRGNKSIRHLMEICQACERNVCNKQIVGKWDESSVTPVFREGPLVRDDLIPVFGNPAYIS